MDQAQIEIRRLAQIKIEIRRLGETSNDIGDHVFSSIARTAPD